MKFHYSNVIYISLWTKTYSEGSWKKKQLWLITISLVGVSSDGLSFQNMQRDKFEQAAMCIQSEKKDQNEAESVAIMSPKPVCKNTAEYWKIKYEMAQNLIRETQAKSLLADGIPGFLKINKVKPKVTSTNTRVNGTSCHNILRSVYTKTSCKQNGERPVMDTAAGCIFKSCQIGYYYIDLTNLATKKKLMTLSQKTKWVCQINAVKMIHTKQILFKTCSRSGSSSVHQIKKMLSLKNGFVCVIAENKPNKVMLLSCYDGSLQMKMDKWIHF